MFLSNNELIKYKKLNDKKFRNQSKYFLIEGIHLIEEALKANLLISIITSNHKYINQNIDVKYTSYQNICKLSTTKTPQEYIGICKKFIVNKIDSKQILILNKINDPGNLGTLIRTALAFNFDTIIVDGVDIYNSKVLRASQGAIFKINIFNCNNLNEYIDNLKKQNIKIIGALLDKSSIDYREININPINKYALILGNEANGIENEIIKLLDIKTYIPINFESLNIAVAGGILMSKLNKTQH